MAERTISCGFCGKTFQVEDGVSKAFCVHCGAETIVGEKTIQEVLDEIYEPKKRYNYLEEYLEKNPEDEKANLLADLFEIRYFHRKKETFDGFLRLWFDMVTYARKRDKAKELMNIRNEIKGFFEEEKVAGFRAQSQQAEDLFWHEMSNAIELYYVSSKTDRQYTSSFFNLFRMKGDAVVTKAAKDVVTTGVALLSLCEKTEYTEKLTEISCGAFLKAYPDGLSYYNDALNEWLQSDEGKQAQAGAEAAEAAEITEE